MTSQQQQRSRDFLSRQLHTQTQNFASVCRLSVKSLTDRASFSVIEEGCKELENFLSILEHILNHRMKPSSTWYGAQEIRSFWEFIRVACYQVPHSCLSSVESLKLPQTSFGKGRAWIRMCLMEKRLSEYISTAIQQSKLLGSFYDEGSIMLSDDIGMLADLLLGLNVLDFNFDIKGINLDYPVMPVIDYTPFLKYENGPEGSYPEIKSGVNEISGGELEPEFWKSNCSKLQEQLKRTTEQKNYLDEMLRLRESQFDDLQRQKQRLVEKTELLESERNGDRVQLEAVVSELQSQISHLKKENNDHLKKIELLSLRYEKDEPSFSMSELIELEKRDSSANLDSDPTDDLKLQACDASAPSSDPAQSHLVPASNESVNGRSTCESTSPGLDLPNRGSEIPMREATESTMVLAGSFAGQEEIEPLQDNDVFPNDPEANDDNDDDEGDDDDDHKVSIETKD